MSSRLLGVLLVAAMVSISAGNGGGGSGGRGGRTKKTEEKRGNWPSHGVRRTLEETIAMAHGAGALSVSRCAGGGPREEDGLGWAVVGWGAGRRRRSS